MKINVGDIYEVQPEWAKNETNQVIMKFYPDFKPGAHIKVLEVIDGLTECVTMISINDGPALHIDNSKCGAYMWAFIVLAEVNKGYLVKV